MKKVLQIALGIIAAIGGYVDIGDLVFNAQAGATFGYKTLWALPIGVLGILVYAEMSGRVAAITRKPNFELIDLHFSRRLATIALIASLVVNIATLGAELGGIGIALNLFFDVSDQFFIVVGLLVIAASAFFMPFEWIERVFGYLGLALLVFVAASIKLNPDWGAVAHGFVPHTSHVTLYWYIVVGLIAAAFMPYEIYFYSSGAREEGWGPEDMTVNRMNAILGYGLGGTLAVALLVVAAELFQPAGVDPSHLGTVVLGAGIPFGETGLVIAAVGILFALGGASIDTCFSGAYNLAQHQGWKWGKKEGHRGAPRWTITWVLMFLGGYAVIATGFDPVELTEYAVVLSAMALPLTFLPIMLVSRDRELMGEYVNGPFATVAGWTFFAVVCVLTVAAPILLLATNGGGG